MSVGKNSTFIELKCDLITGITQINHKLKVKFAMVFLFLLGSTLSIPISPVLAASDIDNDGVLDDVDSCPRLQEDYFGDIDGCPSKNLTWIDSDDDTGRNAGLRPGVMRGALRLPMILQRPKCQQQICPPQSG